MIKMHVKQSKIYWRYIKVNPLSFPWWGPNIFDGSTYVIPMWISAHEFNSIDFHEHLKRNFFFWRITQWLCYPFFQNLFFCLSRLGIIDTQGFFSWKEQKENGCVLSKKLLLAMLIPKPYIMEMITTPLFTIRPKDEWKTLRLISHFDFLLWANKIKFLRHVAGYVSWNQI